VICTWSLRFFPDRGARCRGRYFWDPKQQGIPERERVRSTIAVGGTSGVLRLITTLLICCYDYVWALGDIDLILSGQVRALLHSRLDAAVPVHRLMVQGRELPATETLWRFYAQRLYQPAWSDETGPMALADVLLKSIAGAEQEGLRSRTITRMSLPICYSRPGRSRAYPSHSMRHN
jgi:Scaffold domain